MDLGLTPSPQCGKNPYFLFFFLKASLSFEFQKNKKIIYYYQLYCKNHLINLLSSSIRIKKNKFLRNFNLFFLKNGIKIWNFFGHSFVYGQRCFMPKNRKNWPYHFGDIATIPSKTWFFTIFTFSAFLIHPNDQKRFWRARSQFSVTIAI